MERINEAKLSKEETGAIVDALNDLIHQVHPEEEPIVFHMPDGPEGSGGEITQEYADAWNAIMAAYDNDGTTKLELQQLEQDIASGKIKSI
jgi:hypothetical protein